MLQTVLDLIQSIPSPLLLAGGIAMLLLGGHLLVEGAIRIARRLGVSTLLIGLTVVAFGTSAPELAFNVTAAWTGHGELSFGNVVGSNIANIALVLGLAALLHQLVVHSRVIEIELPILIVVSAGSVALAALPPAIAQEGGGRAGYGRIDGLLLVAVFLVMTWAWYRVGQRDRSDPLAAEARERAESEPPAALTAAAVWLVLGLAALVAGGYVAKEGAVSIARWLGLSEALIGLTIVAIATSLPEVATTIVACRRGHTDLAVGNVVGSNLFNILLVLGLTATVAPVPVPARDGWWDLGIMMILTLALLPLCTSNQHRISRRSGLLLLLLYAAYLTFRAWQDVA